MKNYRYFFITRLFITQSCQLARLSCQHVNAVCKRHAVMCTVLTFLIGGNRHRMQSSVKFRHAHSIGNLIRSQPDHALLPPFIRHIGIYYLQHRHAQLLQILQLQKACYGQRKNKRIYQHINTRPAVFIEKSFKCCCQTYRTGLFVRHRSTEHSNNITVLCFYRLDNLILICKALPKPILTRKNKAHGRLAAVIMFCQIFIKLNKLMLKFRMIDSAPGQLFRQLISCLLLCKGSDKI